MRFATSLAALVLVVGCGSADREAAFSKSEHAHTSLGSVTPSASASEPQAEVLPQTSIDKASVWMSRRVDDWRRNTPQVGNNFACATTCHTSVPFATALHSTNLVERESPASWLESGVRERVMSNPDWRSATPYYGTPASDDGKRSLGSEAVLNALVLAGADDREAADRAFVHLWRAQREDGGFDWMDYNLAPWENGDEFVGAALAALALRTRYRGASLEKICKPAASHALTEPEERLASFLYKRREKATGFARAFALWATAELPLAFSDEDGAHGVALLRASQNDDGGFSWSSLGVEAQGAESDATPTATALLAMCGSRTRLDAETRSAARRALAWLARHQAEDGSFEARSPNVDSARNHSLARDAAAGYTVTAWATCRCAFAAE
ncbi:MAG: hypothetical protein U0271_47610 [Polyangiaceae bacterium]